MSDNNQTLDGGMDASNMPATEHELGHSEAELEIPINDHTQRQYSLRNFGGDLKRVCPSTWVDHDASGDYNPDEEARNLRARKRRPKPLVREQLAWYGTDMERIDSAIEMPRRLPLRLPVTLRFTDPAARAKLNEICDKITVSECDDFTAEGYRLRKQKDHALDGPSSHDIKGVDPSYHELLGHPCARGCKSCLRTGMDCSLLFDEHYWPCIACRDDDEDCDLIIPPVRKQACERCQKLRCRQGWIRCSFIYDGGHHGVCDNCARDGHDDCVAGPCPDSIRTRIRYGHDGKLYESSRIPAVKMTVKDNTCRQCQAARRICSFSTMNSISADGTFGNCTACDMSGMTCDPLIAVYPLEKAASKDTQASKKVTGYFSSQKRQAEESQAAESEPDQQDGKPESQWESNSPQALIRNPFANEGTLPTEKNRSSYSMSGALPEAAEVIDLTEDEPLAGKVKRIQTRFCHPMRFNWQRTTEMQCHFCSDACFPLLALEERVVEVIEWKSGEGLEELSGGHAGEGVENTRVCLSCTMARLEIIMCEKHQMRPFAGVSAVQNQETALARLLDRDPAIGNYKWCAVCCNLATHQCSAGCGLQLCGHCVTLLAYECGWDFEQMLRRVSVVANNDERPLGLRADYELLKRDGLLTRYVAFSNER